MVIATRELTFRTETGDEVFIPVSLFSPVRNDQDWGCQYSIEWPDGIETESAYGIDSVQALISMQRLLRMQALLGASLRPESRLRKRTPNSALELLRQPS